MRLPKKESTPPPEGAEGAVAQREAVDRQRGAVDRNDAAGIVAVDDRRRLTGAADQREVLGQRQVLDVGAGRDADGVAGWEAACTASAMSQKGATCVPLPVAQLALFLSTYQSVIANTEATANAGTRRNITIASTPSCCVVRGELGQSLAGSRPPGGSSRASRATRR